MEYFELKSLPISFRGSDHFISFHLGTSNSLILFICKQPKIHERIRSNRTECQNSIENTQRLLNAHKSLLINNEVWAFLYKVFFRRWRKFMKWKQIRDFNNVIENSMKSNKALRSVFGDMKQTHLACVRIYWKDNNYYRQLRTTIQLYQHNSVSRECNSNICSVINNTAYDRIFPVTFKRNTKYSFNK